MDPNDFYSALSRALICGAYDFQPRNVDLFRFPFLNSGRLGRFRTRLKESILARARQAGFAYVNAGAMDQAAKSVGEVLQRSEGLARTYSRLGDEYSRQVLIAVLAFRALGNQRIKLPANEPGYWDAARRIERELLVRPQTFPIPLLDGFLNEYDLRGAGWPIRLHAHRLNVLNTFSLQQYRYAHDEHPIEAQPGDVVIDGGGCWGDTALYFAHQAGSGGRVFCFEFVPENLKVLRANLDLNPELKPRVEVFQQALWSRSGESVAFAGAGPGTQVSQGNGESASRVCTRSIDDLVADLKLDRVDFIKLDIEGAELMALKGAARTLREFRPRLAVALYHSLDDFICIPAFIDSLEADYELRLDHFTIHSEETVLFARPRGSRRTGAAPGISRRDAL
jgi:FkbM family methyltransferase